MIESAPHRTRSMLRKLCLVVSVVVHASLHAGLCGTLNSQTRARGLSLQLCAWVLEGSWQRLRSSPTPSHQDPQRSPVTCNRWRCKSSQRRLGRDLLAAAQAAVRGAYNRVTRHDSGVGIRAQGVEFVAQKSRRFATSLYHRWRLS